MSPQPASRTSPEARARSRKILIGAGIGAVVIAVLIALLVGGEEDQPTSTGADAAVEVADSVTVSGSPLPRYTDA